MRLPSMLLYGLSSIFLLHCASKKPIETTSTVQSDSIEELESMLRDINSGLSSTEMAEKILYLAELYHQTGNLPSSRNWYAQFALDYPKATQKGTAILGLALIDATLSYPNVGSSNLGKLESIPNQSIPPFTNISRYVLLSRYYEGKNQEKMVLYGRQAQGLAKVHTKFAYLLDDLPKIPIKESKETNKGKNDPKVKPEETQNSESLSLEETILQDLEQLALQENYDELSRKSASFLIDFPDHPQKGRVQAYQERAKAKDPFTQNKVCVLLPQEGKYGPTSIFFERSIQFANTQITNSVDLSFYDTGIYSYEAQLTEETAKERAERLKKQEKESEEERQLRLDEENQLREEAQVQTDIDIYKLIGTMVTEEGCALLIGPMLKDTVLSAAQAAQDYQIPMLTLSKKTDPIEKGDYVFFSNISPQNQIGALVRHAMSVKGWTKFAVMAPDTELGKESAEFFEMMVEENGGSIVQESLFYDEEKSSFIPEARKLGQKPEEQTDDELEGIELLPVYEFEALFIPDNYQRTYHVASSLAYEGFPLGTFKPLRESIPVGMLGLNSWNNPKIIQQYMIGGVFVDGFFVEEEREIIQNFVGAYEAEYNKKPGFYDAWLYDTLQIASNAMQLAQEKYNTEKRLGIQKSLATMDFDQLLMEGSSFNETRTIDRDLKIVEIDEEGLLLYQPPLDEDYSDEDYDEE